MAADLESRTLGGSAEWQLHPEVCQRILQDLGPCQVDLFATKLNNQLPRYISWRPDPFSMAVDAFRSSWTDLQGYGGGVNSATSGPCVANTGVVPPASGTTDRPPGPSPATPQPPLRPSRQDSPASARASSSTSRLEGIRQKQLSQGISGEAADLMAAGWSKGTNKSYQSAWKKWVSWCGVQQVDPFSCDVSYFVNFLADLFKQGLQYRSINTIRSAVSVTHVPVGGVPMGQHPMITRLMKGISNRRPALPRYTSTWNVDTVTSHIQGMGQNNTMPIKLLSWKLVVLMALVDASRTSELAALDLKYRVFTPEGVRFTLSKLTKKCPS